MLKVGLTGGIGSGKTTVAHLFAASGVPVLDADHVARDLVEPGQSAFEAIVRRFGPDLLQDGRLDRAWLRRLAFAVPEVRQWLEALLHPRVYDEMRRRVAGLSAPYCLLVIPLLLETGRRDFVDRVLVVDCPIELQRQRVKTRDGSDDAEIDRILSTQLGREARLAAADEIIENLADREQLSEQVNRLHRFYLSLCQETPPAAID